MPIEWHYEKTQELCEHMEALLLHMEGGKLHFGGCGDCESAWLKCDACESGYEISSIGLFGNRSGVAQR